MEALGCLTQPTLRTLDLGNNYRWWRQKSQSCFRLLLNVLATQVQLRELLLFYSRFSERHTEELLRKITESEMLNTISHLNIQQSADFTSDESVSLFAEILSKSPNLTKVNIARQRGVRKVDLEIDEVKEWKEKRYQYYPDYDQLKGGIINADSTQIIIYDRETRAQICCTQKLPSQHPLTIALKTDKEDHTSQVGSNSAASVTMTEESKSTSTMSILRSINRRHEQNNSII